MVERFGTLADTSGGLKAYSPIAQPVFDIPISDGKKHVLAVHIADELDRMIYQDPRSKFLESQNKLVLLKPDYVPGYNRLIGPERYLYGSLRIGICILLMLLFINYLNPGDQVTWYVVLLCILFTIATIAIVARNMNGMSLFHVRLRSKSIQGDKQGF